MSRRHAARDEIAAERAKRNTELRQKIGVRPGLYDQEYRRRRPIRAAREWMLAVGAVGVAVALGFGIIVFL